MAINFNLEQAIAVFFYYMVIADGEVDAHEINYIGEHSFCKQFNVPDHLDFVLSVIKSDLDLIDIIKTEFPLLFIEKDKNFRSQMMHALIDLVVFNSTRGDGEIDDSENAFLTLVSGVIGCKDGELLEFIEECNDNSSDYNYYEISDKELDYITLEQAIAVCFYYMVIADGEIDPQEIEYVNRNPFCIRFNVPNHLDFVVSLIKSDLNVIDLIQNKLPVLFTQKDKIFRSHMMHALIDLLIHNSNRGDGEIDETENRLLSLIANVIGCQDGELLEFITDRNY